MPTVETEDPSRPVDLATPVENLSGDAPAAPLRVLAESVPFGLIAIGVAVWIYRLWDQAWSVPFRSAGPDVTFIESMVKASQDHGWYLHNPSLNAPFGQQFYDYPHAGENLQLLALRVISLFTSTPGQTVNVYYLLGFAALTMVTFAVFRHLRFGPLASGAAALLYAFLPYHLWHMEDHLYRSTYLSAPLASLLLLWGLSWRTTLLRDPDGPVWGPRALLGNLQRKRAVSALLLLGVVATFETMTIAFFLTTLALASIVVAIRRRDPAQLGVVGIALATCGLAFAISMAPNLRYWAANGTNKDTGRRTPTEQEAFGLQVSQLVLPVPGHRIAALRGLQKNARKRSPIAGEGGQELGFIGAAGLFALLYWALAGGVRRRVDEPLHDRGLLREHAALCTLILIPVASVSGFALILSIEGFAQVRVWNRAVVIIGFFAMMAVAMGIERFLSPRRVATSFWRSRPVAIGAVALLTAFGLFDTTVLRYAPYGTQANIAELRPFLGSTKKLLPADAEVFQLPITPFPETPAKGSTQEYDQLLPYLWTNGLRWSAGGLRGRTDADWQLKVFADGTVASLPALRGLGFDALEIDTHGYDDGGVAAVAELTKELGAPTIRSATGRWLLWDLRSWAAKKGLSPAAARAAATKLVGDDINRVPQPK